MRKAKLRHKDASSKLAFSNEISMLRRTKDDIQAKTILPV
jgi:hypothetical protein